MREALRDALIADVTPPEMRGRAFGPRQPLDTVGAFVGPLPTVSFRMLLSLLIGITTTLAATARPNDPPSLEAAPE